jgi:CDP-6-deoxy-D-xylo-4-hexulose-3-dehydrase
MVGAVLDFWLTAGPETEKFEHQLGDVLGVREVIPVNAGSSANLVTHVRSATRYRGPPEKRHHILGLRLARSAPAP